MFCKYGHPMVLRDGQYGEFYGCSAYPSCKETESIYSSNSRSKPEKNYSKSIFLGIVDILLKASFIKAGYGRQYRLAKKTTKYVYKKANSPHKKTNLNYKGKTYTKSTKTNPNYRKSTSSASSAKKPTAPKKKATRRNSAKNVNTDNLKITKSQEDKMYRLLENIRDTDLEIKIINKLDSNITRKEYKLLVEEIETFLLDRKTDSEKKKKRTTELEKLDQQDNFLHEPTLEDLEALEEESLDGI